MPIQQVSVFLDNKPGSLSELMTHLDKFQIRIFALSIAEAGEFGVVRMITEDPKKLQKFWKMPISTLPNQERTSK